MRRVKSTSGNKLQPKIIINYFLSFLLFLLTIFYH